MSNTQIVLIVAAIVAAALTLFLIWRHERLKARFGPEYDRAVRAKGAWRGESELEHRAKRVSHYHIRPLSPDESSRFSTAWRQLQSRFVDNPTAAVSAADSLVTDLMACRGYPMTEFEQRAEDISVDHPQVVSHYRDAHRVAARPPGESRVPSTEDLRQAVVHYRALFDELLEVATTPAPARRPA
jgi:hypothetical protein